MKAAATVLKDFDLFGLMTEYQFGLPEELVDLTRIAESIVITPCYYVLSSSPKAFLSNIPLRFTDTPYLQLHKSCNNLLQLPNYALFLEDYYYEPTLPLHLSIVENNITLVQQWIKHKPQWLTPAPLKLAAACGHLEIVQILINASKNTWTAEAMDLAAMNGYLDVVKWIHNLDNGPGCTTNAMDGAAVYGHLDVVQFLNEHRSLGCTSIAFTAAATNGYASVVNYLLQEQREMYADEYLFQTEFYRIRCHRSITKRDYMGVMKSFQRHQVLQVNERVVYKAIQADPLPILEFVHQSKLYGITMRMLTELIKIGDASAIRYALEAVMRENNRPISLLDNENDSAIEQWTPEDNEFTFRSRYLNSGWKFSTAMDAAARLGDFDTIKLLHRSGIKCCTSNAIDNASSIGRLDIIQWLCAHRTEGCSAVAMTNAIQNGHLDTAKWLHHVFGYRSTTNDLIYAARNGDCTLLAYLISIGVEITKVEWTHLGYQSFPTLVCMPHDISILSELTDVVNEAASSGHINIIEMLQCYSATTQAMDNAVSSGHLDIVKYLHQHRTEGCSAQAFKSAVKFNRFDILKYLVANKCCHDGDVDYEQLCVCAAGAKNIDMLVFCMSQLHTDITPNSKEWMMCHAAIRGDLETVKWLHENQGFGWTLVIREVAERRGLKEIVKYFDAIGNPQTSGLANVAQTIATLEFYNQGFTTI